MKNVYIDDAYEGLVLAEDVLDNSGSLLAKKETTLTMGLINKMTISNVRKISVHNDEEKIVLINDNDREKIISLLINTINSAKLLGKDYLSAIKNKALEAASEIMLEDDALYILNELAKIDDYTIKHSIRVALIGALIAEWEHFDNKLIKKAFVSGLFSQVGKLDVPKNLLVKETPLDDNELMLLRNYCKYSHKYLQNLNFLDQEEKTAIMKSTERLDGSGLPNKLKKDEISELSQIICVANIFDAAVHDKPYKKACSPFKLSIELFEDSIEKLSPKATLPLIKAIEKAFLGMKVELSNGEIGEVIFMNKLDSKRPLVKVGEKIYDLSMSTEKVSIIKMYREE